MEKVYIAVYKSRRLVHALKVVSVVASAVFAIAFGLLLYHAFKISFSFSLIIFFGSASSFFAVSLARRIIGAPRPCDFYDCIPKTEHEIKKRSFPSRHAFSAFFISFLILPFNVFLGISLIAVSTVMCVCRVLLGIHFIRDVAAGGIVGALSGLFLFYVASFFCQIA